MGPAWSFWGPLIWFSKSANCLWHSIERLIPVMEHSWGSRENRKVWSVLHHSHREILGSLGLCCTDSKRCLSPWHGVNLRHIGLLRKLFLEEATRSDGDSDYSIGISCSCRTKVTVTVLLYIHRGIVVAIATIFSTMSNGIIAILITSSSLFQK